MSTNSRGDKWRIAAVVVGVGSLLFSLAVFRLGYVQKKVAVGEQVKQVVAAARPELDVTSQLNPLTDGYLKSNPGEAREYLVKSIRLIQESKLTDWQIMSASKLPYARLYVLDKRMGNPVLADADLVKAKYCYVRALEGGQNSDIEAARALAEMTSEAFEKMVDEFDKARTGGEGPVYARSIAPQAAPATRP